MTYDCKDDVLPLINNDYTNYVLSLINQIDSEKKLINQISGVPFSMDESRKGKLTKHNKLDINYYDGSDYCSIYEL